MSLCRPRPPSELSSRLQSHRQLIGNLERFRKGGGGNREVRIRRGVPFLQLSRAPFLAPYMRNTDCGIFTCGEACRFKRCRFFLLSSKIQRKAKTDQANMIACKFGPYTQFVFYKGHREIGVVLALKFKKFK